MADAYHLFGSDLQVGATGDILTATGTEYGQQRVLRRLLTNPGDYLWSLDYGAGLARFVGQPASAPQLVALTRAQMRREASVALSPEPGVAVDVTGNGVVTETIQYVDAATGTTQTLDIPVKP